MQDVLNIEVFEIKRPEKIRWQFEKKTSQLLESIPSKSLRVFLEKKDEILAKNNISYTYLPLTKGKFLEWLELYTKKTLEYGYQNLVSANLYEEEIVQGETLEGLFFYRDGALFTGALIFRQGKTRAILGYSAREHIRLGQGPNATLGCLVDYIFFQKMEELGVGNISGGKSRNAFGIYNNVGYLEFKLRIGYHAVPAEDTSYVSSVPLNNEGCALFFGIQSQEQYLFACRPKNTHFFSTATQYRRDGVSFKLLEY